MNGNVKKVWLTFFILSFGLLLVSCGGGGGQVVPVIPGEEPTQVLFEENLGVPEEEAEKLMEEVGEIQNDLFFINNNWANSGRGTLNGEQIVYLGNMTFGLYPNFHKYQIAIEYIGIEQDYTIYNSSGSCTIKTYISEQNLGQTPTKETLTNNASLFFTMDITEDGDHTLSVNSKDSDGAKEILNAINESIVENKQVMVYVYTISEFDDFDDQFMLQAEDTVLTMTVNLNLDKPNKNPVIEKIAGPEGQTVNPQSEFQWDGNDPDGNINEYIITKDGATETTQAKTAIWSDYSQGQHTFKVKAIDNRGGESNELTWTFTYAPNQAPSVQKVDGPPAEIEENTATFEWTGSDTAAPRAIAKYQYKKDTGNWTDYGIQTTYTWNDISEGSHTFSVRAVDDEDATSEPVTWTFTYTPPPPPTYTLTVEADPSAGGNIQIETQGWKDTDTITVEEGTEVQVQAQAAEGYIFEGWYDGQTKLSNNNAYTITVNAEQTLTGKFTQDTPPEETLFKDLGPEGNLNESGNVINIEDDGISALTVGIRTDRLPEEFQGAEGWKIIVKGEHEYIFQQNVFAPQISQTDIPHTVTDDPEDIRNAVFEAIQ